MIKSICFFFYLIRMSIRASIQKRGVFLFECGLMITNNFIFFSIWWIFFRQFNDIAGWNFHDMLILTAIGTGAYGLMQVCFGGTRFLSQIIVNGDLDAFLTQPKDPLFHIAASKSLSKGWGNVLTSFLVILFGGLTSPYVLVLILLGVLSGCFVFTAMTIIAHSMAFWMGSIEGLSKKYCDTLFLFALYPTNIYSGVIQLVMFTLIPAGLIGYVPVELIRDFTWFKLCVMVGSSFLFFMVAIYIFNLGLKRYESGNKFGVRL